MTEICPHCKSENTQKTGIVYYSNPAQIEYYCFDCKQTFRVMESCSIPEAPLGYQRRPELKGCFNCNNYTNETEDFSVFKCLKSEIKPAYTDVCDLWEKYKEQDVNNQCK